MEFHTIKPVGSPERIVLYKNLSGLVFLKEIVAILLKDLTGLWGYLNGLIFIRAITTLICYKKASNLY